MIQPANHRELFDAQPPADLDSESALLAAAVKDPSQLDWLMSTVTPSDFHDDANAALYDALVAGRDAGEPIHDPTVLVRLLKNMGRAEQWPISGIARLTENGIVWNTRHYADQVKRFSQLRKQLDVAKGWISRIYRSDSDPSTTSNWVDSQLGMLGVTGHTEDRLIGDIAKDVMAEILSPQTSQRGVLTGLHAVDEIVGKMMPGEVTVMAARPGNGKTSFACQVSLNASTHGRQVLFASLEMRANEVTRRHMCSLANVDERRVRAGTLLCNEVEALRIAKKSLDGLPYRLWAPAESSISDIRARARLRKKTTGLDLLLIDYISLISASDPRRPRWEQVSEISGSLKRLAKELEVPVIALCQLNRDSDGSSSPPTLGQLRESGAIEQDADVVLLLHRIQTTSFHFIVAKNRHGSTGVIPMTFEPARTRFVG